MSIEKDLRVHIQTTSDTTGAKEASTAFDKLGERATEGWRETDKIRESMHKLREITNIIAENALPGMGSALLNTLEGPVGLTIALGLAFTYLRDKFNEFVDDLDQKSEKLADPEFKEAMDAKREAMDAALLSAAAYTDKLAHLISSEDEYKTAIKGITDALHEQFAAQAAIDDAQKGAAEANIEKRRKLGTITDADAIIERAKVEDFYHQKKIDQTNEEAQATLRLKQTQLDHANAFKSNTDPEAAAKADARAKADAKLLADQIEQQKDRDKAVAEARDQYDKHIGNPGYYDVRYDEGSIYRQPVIDKLARAEEEQQKGLALIKQLQGKVPEENKDAQTAAAELERNRAAETQNKQDKAALEAEVAALQAKISIQGAAQPQINAANRSKASDDLMSELLGTKEGQETAKLHTIEEALRLHQKVSAADLEFYNSIVTLLQQTGHVQAATMQVVRQSVSDWKSLKEEIDAVRAAQRTQNQNTTGH